MCRCLQSHKSRKKGNEGKRSIDSRVAGKDRISRKDVCQTSEEKEELEMNVGIHMETIHILEERVESLQESFVQIELYSG